MPEDKSEMLNQEAEETTQAAANAGEQQDEQAGRGQEREEAQAEGTQENEQFDFVEFRKYFNREMAARRKEAEALKEALEALAGSIAKPAEEGNETEAPDVEALVQEKVLGVAADYERRLQLERAARKMGFKNEVDAAKLALTLYGNEVKVEKGEDGLKVEGVEEALKKLAEQYPAFLERAKAPRYLDEESTDGGNQEPDVRSMFGF